ncbi:MAG: ANTAR domain-containing protein [Lachnospiraceae bacterium]|nr:ANTAR domain-containing protein [Lachnospiraceae bacterium]
MTNIIVGFSRSAEAKGIKDILVRSGFNCIGTAATGAEVLSIADDIIDGIVVCGYKFPDMLYDELGDYLGENFDMLLVTRRASLVERTDSGILCLEMPLKVNDLVDTLEMMVENCERRRRKRRERPRARSSEEQEIINGAKLLLMQRNDMSEEEAHRYLQKISMDSGTNMVESAQMVLRIM